VVSGKLQVLKTATIGESIQIATLAAGRSIGEMSIIDETPRSATAVAETDAALLSMSKADFTRLIDGHPATAVKILKGMARLLSMNLRKTSSRLADYLLALG
jgi:CRP/FNR family cyclic AMP-dependent transcriptional regulator